MKTGRQRVLTKAEARSLYNRIGALQDTQGFYENRALAALIAHASFETARAVFEFGCGTGRFAAGLLSDALAPDARYVGVDISPTMVGLAEDRLRRWSDRAQVRLSDGAMTIDAPDGSLDRMVSTFVFDLLSAEDITTLVAEAARTLVLDGRLCLVSLTEGQGPLSHLVSSVWTRLHALRPQLVGGCRPIHLLDFLHQDHWEVTYHTVISAVGISSEVVVARRTPRSGSLGVSAPQAHRNVPENAGQGQVAERDSDPSGGPE